MPKINKAKIVFFIIMIEAIISLSFFNLYAATPQRPWYSETPNPRHIANNDRLTAEYFNNQLNVIYNWAQNTNAELDNLLHNGIGVASLTVGILNCTNKIINPEWDNLLHNGNGVASITANLVKAQDLEIANSIDVPAIEFSGRSQPTPPVNNGMLYFDSDLQRFRVYQENAWRDLSSNIVIASDSLNNPLVIQGYISASNIYATNSATINQNLTVKQNINSSGTATIQNVNILNDSTINRNLTVKGNINSSGTANIKNLNVTDNSTINKNLTVKGKLNASGPAILESLKVNKTLKVPVTASTTLGVGSVYYDTIAGKLKVLNSSNSWDTVGNDIAIDSYMSSTSTNPVQNKVVTSWIDRQLGSGTSNLDVNSVKTKDIKVTNSLAIPSWNGDLSLISGGDSSKLYFDTASKTIGFMYLNGNLVNMYKLAKNNEVIANISTGDNDGTIKFTRNDVVVSTNVAVKGLGSAAYANVASFSSPTHNHDSSYAAKNHNHDSSYATINHTHTYDSELNDTSTNAVQNKKIKAYIDSHSSDIASRTLVYNDIYMTKFTNPTYSSSYRVVWDETRISSECLSVELYVVSDYLKILRCAFSTPNAAGTYGLSMSSNPTMFQEIMDAINGSNPSEALELQSITCYDGSFNGTEVENPKIIRTSNYTYNIAFDLKNTPLDTSSVIYVNLVYRKFKDDAYH